MGKTSRFILMLLAVLSAGMGYSQAESDGIPWWMKAVRADVSAALQTSFTRQRTDGYDPVDNKIYKGYKLCGQGSLKAVPDPFNAVRGAFSTRKGWKEELRYAADGHGSSAFAFRKGSYLCRASIWIDSDCDDEKTGHVPSLFWFCMNCRSAK